MLYFVSYRRLLGILLSEKKGRQRRDGQTQEEDPGEERERNKMGSKSKKLGGEMGKMLNEGKGKSKERIKTKQSGEREAR